MVVLWHAAPRGQVHFVDRHRTVNEAPESAREAIHDFIAPGVALGAALIEADRGGTSKQRPYESVLCSRWPMSVRISNL